MATENAVGPVLRMCDEVESVIAAIREDNPDSDIEVIDRGSYVRVQAPDKLIITEATLQEYLGSRLRDPVAGRHAVLLRRPDHHLQRPHRVANRCQPPASGRLRQGRKS